jgi:flagellar L-ring protein FlgH
MMERVHDSMYVASTTRRMHGNLACLSCFSWFALIVLCALGERAQAQSLNVPPEVRPASISTPGSLPPTDPLFAHSLIAVKPPEPKTYKKHDLVTIVIDESSSQKAEQSLETNKKYDLAAALSQFPSLRNLLELQLVSGDGTAGARLGLNSDQKFSGDGKFERKDRFTARITARVVDVKPNGVLVLEARKHVAKNEEITSILIAGEARQHDITDKNTVLSSQMADLTLVAESSGEVDKASEKGLIPRVLERLFAF